MKRRKNRRIPERRILAMTGNILTYVMFAFMCIVGGGSTVYLVIAMPTIIIWKLYRKFRYHENLMD